MVRRTGKRGPFLGCSRYPQCTGTRSLAGAGAR
jgi:ssDNA-binding Zn-finger/Zn-ribbon topoisomerase 1